MFRIILATLVLTYASASAAQMTWENPTNKELVWQAEQNRIEKGARQRKADHKKVDEIEQVFANLMLRYPILDPDKPEFKKEVLTLVINEQARLVRNGVLPAQALHQAGVAIAENYQPKAQQPSPTLPTKTEIKNPFTRKYSDEEIDEILGSKDWRTPEPRRTMQKPASDEYINSLAKGLLMGVVVALLSGVVILIKRVSTKGKQAVSNIVRDVKAANKKCPFCAETIKSAAIVCRHCGRNLPTAEASAHGTS